MYILFDLIPKLASVFGGGSFSKTVALSIQFWFFALTRKTFLRGKGMRFDLVFFKRPFVLYIESIVDLAALKEVYLLREYAWEPISKPKIIIDLGAHFGDTTLYYHLRYPDAHIYAVEPAPETFKRLVMNTRSISNITTIQAGVAENDGFAELHIGASSLGSSFKSRSATENAVMVPTMTLQSLLLKCGIDRADIVKFDIEGAEESLFMKNSPSEFADAYIGEVHADLISIDPSELIAKFNDFAIEKTDLSNPSRFILKAKSKRI